jgi:hypothetical protein
MWIWKDQEKTNHGQQLDVIRKKRREEYVLLPARRSCGHISCVCLLSIYAKLTELGYGDVIEKLQQSRMYHRSALDAIKTINVARKLTAGGKLP